MEHVQDKGIPRPLAAAGRAGMTVELSKVLHYFVYSVIKVPVN
jgi:hypothetical protein